MRGVVFRLLWLALLVVAVFSASRLIVRTLPGDPLETLVAESGTQLPRELLRAELKLDRALLPALAADLASAARGDFGTSLLTRQPIAPVLGERVARTAALATLALLLGLSISLPLGLAAAARPRGLASRACEALGAWTAALPMPWIGPMMLVAFAVWIPAFPVGGHVALPAITVALAYSGFWARLIRERVRDTLQRGAAPGARARGIAEWKVVTKYGLAPASGAVAAYLGTQLGGLLAGSFVAEVVFDWPGLGQLLVEAVQRRDYPVVEAASFAAAAASVGGTALGDLAQRLLDPRLRANEDTA